VSQNPVGDNQGYDSLPTLETSDTGIRGLPRDGDSVYVSARTRGRMKLLYVDLPLPGVQRDDDVFFRQVKKSYCDIRGTRGARNVLSFKFVKVRSR
jgi:hypothetical protein